MVYSNTFLNFLYYVYSIVRFLGLVSFGNYLRLIIVLKNIKTTTTKHIRRTFIHDYIHDVHDSFMSKVLEGFSPDPGVITISS